MNKATLALWITTSKSIAEAKLICDLLCEHPWVAPSGKILSRCTLYAPMRFAKTSIHPYSNLKEALAASYSQAGGHLFLSATGIAVRVIAPLLTHKSVDPPVLVLSNAFVIPLLSGHLGGGNSLAKHLANLLHKTAVITTASDQDKEVFAIDLLAQQKGLAILDWRELPALQGLLLEKTPLNLYDPLHLFLPHPLLKVRNSLSDCAFEPTISVDYKRIAPRSKLLRLAMPSLILGVGCKQGIHTQQLQEWILAFFEEEQLEPKAFCALATVAEKKSELFPLAQALKLPLQTFQASTLAKRVTPNPSLACAKRFQVPPFSVCEAAALEAGFCVSSQTKLILPKKRIGGKLTLAVAATKPHLL